MNAPHRVLLGTVPDTVAPHVRRAFYLESIAKSVRLVTRIVPEGTPEAPR